MIQKNLLMKQKEIHRLTKQIYSCRGEEIIRDFGKASSFWALYR